MLCTDFCFPGGTPGFVWRGASDLPIGSPYVMSENIDITYHTSFRGILDRKEGQNACLCDR